MAFLLALDAGHYLKTAGRRISKKFDKNQTREWVLNDRVARYIALYAKEYEEVLVKRVDDTTGKTLIKLQKRCNLANEWKADFYLSIHHNAGVGGGKGGGIVAYGYKKPFTFRDAIYKACVAATGLKGNRSKPLVSKGYYVLKHTKMMSVLMEYGFMDSSTDAPIILTEEYAEKVAKATVEAIAQVAGLEKKTVQEETAEKPNTKEEVCEVKLRVLKNGDSGNDVKAMQQLLEANGCKGKMDSKKYGSFGSKTEAALNQFKKKKKLPQNGKCDADTWAALLGTH